MGTEALDIMGKALDVNTIKKILPHRYPFLLVDKIIESREGHIVGIKNVTINEPFFQGHFPGYPIMPGVLIIEAMAQVGGIGALSMKANLGKLAFFASINNARFRKPVVPGDVLRLEIDLLNMKLGMMKIRGVAKVADDVVAEADLMCAFINEEKKG